MERKFKDRLLKLAKFLRTLRGSKKFNLEVLVDNEDFKEDEFVALPKPSKKYANPKENFCGTAACAVGWCPVVFPKDCEYILDDLGAVSYVKDKNSSRLDFSWAEHFFNLTYGEAEYLFMPENYPYDHKGPVSVARRIEKFVKDGKVPHNFGSW